MKKQKDNSIYAIIILILLIVIALLIYIRCEPITHDNDENNESNDTNGDNDQEPTVTPTPETYYSCEHQSWCQSGTCPPGQTCQKVYETATWKCKCVSGSN